MINPLWPDAQPYDTWLFVVVAAVVVWINRYAMFTHQSAVTDVIPEEKKGDRKELNNLKRCTLWSTVCVMPRVAGGGPQSLKVGREVYYLNAPPLAILKE